MCRTLLSNHHSKYKTYTHCHPKFCSSLTIGDFSPQKCLWYSVVKNVETFSQRVALLFIMSYVRVSVIYEFDLRLRISNKYVPNDQCLMVLCYFMCIPHFCTYEQATRSRELSFDYFHWYASNWLQWFKLKDKQSNSCLIFACIF